MIEIRDEGIDRKRFNYGSELSQAELGELERNAIDGFRDELLYGFRSRLKPIRGLTLNEVMDNALAVEKQIERDRIKHGEYKRGESQPNLPGSRAD